MKWTFIFIIVCIFAFFLQILGFLDEFSFTPSLAFQRPWTFITSVFLHASFSHLFMNMIVLFFLGLFLESRIGPKHFIILFVLAGIVGNMGYMLTAFNSSIPAVGASGAIYGILGALAIITPFAMVWIWGIIPMPMIGVAILWGILDFFGLFIPGEIAHGAHLGGLIVGVFYGLYLKRKMKKRLRKILIDIYS